MRHYFMLVILLTTPAAWDILKEDDIESYNYYKQLLEVLQ